MPYSSKSGTSQLQPYPGLGCGVTLIGRDEVGVVVDISEAQSELAVCVRWVKSDKREMRDISELRCGFKVGDAVYAQSSAKEGSVIEDLGRIVQLRTLGQRVQLLVEFREQRERRWMPWQRLKRRLDPCQVLSLDTTLTGTCAERFRLRVLADAIEHWNANTGALARLNIDPLPHQINLVHHIRASGTCNWLIADDVGLGKTIEVGLLLTALEAVGKATRVLIVTPAGLVEQWREEMKTRFEFDDFEIVGSRGTRIQEAVHWKMKQRVIASIDFLKREDEREKLESSGEWDIVIFDEAHRLSMTVRGNKRVKTDRYLLAKVLRSRTGSLLLLSATPHQGDSKRFSNLLELIRPEEAERLADIEGNPELLRDMVFRNRKETVTDMQGNQLFQGKLVKRISVSSAPDHAAFDEALSDYFRRGYEAEDASRSRGKAIGLVMTVYRKLSSSSLAAVHIALQRRLHRLEGTEDAIKRNVQENEYFEGEAEEQSILATEGQAAFFDGEAELLRTLVCTAADLLTRDPKIARFLELVDEQSAAGSDSERLVIFTEYRSTQDYVSRKLRDRYGEHSVSLINGSMSVHERQNAIRDFESSGRFLVSTEAGGEGLNMQKCCHVMVNFDLPWNPMRLVQRIGRLYRYGQKHQVVVFNLANESGIDERILAVMYHRLDQVARDLSGAHGDFDKASQHEWLGELADGVDIQGVLQNARGSRDSRAADAIERALDEAKIARSRQDDLLRNATGFDAGEMSGQLELSIKHVKSFVEGMCRQLGISVTGLRDSPNSYRLLLSQELKMAMGLRYSSLTITFDRELAAVTENLEMMDLKSTLLPFLLDYARNEEFAGRHAVIVSDESVAIAVGKLRWQDEHGFSLRQEFSIAALSKDKPDDVQLNPTWVSDWLLAAGQDSEDAIPKPPDQGDYSIHLHRAFDNRLAENSNQYLHPEDYWVVAAARCIVGENESSGEPGDMGVAA